MFRILPLIYFCLQNICQPPGFDLQTWGSFLRLFIKNAKKRGKKISGKWELLQKLNAAVLFSGTKLMRKQKQLLFDCSLKGVLWSLQMTSAELRSLWYNHLLFIPEENGKRDRELNNMIAD